MKGIINSDGFLLLERHGLYIRQRCHYKDEACGDWCTIFGEPKFIEEQGGHEGHWEIELCQSTTEKALVLEELIDERTTARSSRVSNILRKEQE